MWKDDLNKNGPSGSNYPGHARRAIIICGWGREQWCYGLSAFRRTLFLYGIRPSATTVWSRIVFSMCLTYHPTPLWFQNSHWQHQNAIQAGTPKAPFFKTSGSCTLPLWTSLSLKLSSESLVLLVCHLEDPSVLDKRNRRAHYPWRKGNSNYYDSWEDK